MDEITSSDDGLNPIANIETQLIRDPVEPISPNDFRVIYFSEHSLICRLLTKNKLWTPMPY